ncbi:ABC transporter substrate-binding protein [Bordetella sp. N]|uniref:ABC transporter substrate-binding protein n=1 Tax=Bordetella sp. N TaxID=1746199 RepID=UPI0009E73EC9|nr:ABC transporter substrate-binding protein [Bordetella sp. N]
MAAGTLGPLALAACSKSDDKPAAGAANAGGAAATPSGTTASASTSAGAPRTLTIAQGNDILSLDPANHGNNSTEASLVNIYEYLIDKDFSGESLVFKPRLAQSWSQDDPLTWTFRLRRDVTWHDGQPFTARDVQFTVERTQQNKKLINNAKFRTIAKVEVVDDYTVRIHTDAPDPLLLHSFVGNGAGILPRHALTAAAGEEAFFRKPIGTGPYRYDQWIKADRLILQAYPKWWGGKPKWDTVVVRAIPETTTRVSEFITGGVDIAVNVPPEDIARIKANAGTRIVAFDIARNLALHVRTGEGYATHDPRVREAIDLAIDRNALAKQVVEGYAVPTRGFYPSRIPGYDPALSKDLRYDPERARALLREAGHTEPVPIKLSSPSGRYVKDREISEAVAGYLQDAGFQVKLEVLDWTVYNNRMVGDNFGELYLWGMGSYTDGSTLFRDEWKRHYAWRDEEFEKLRVDVGRAPDEAHRIAIIQRGQEIIAGQRVRIGLVYPQAIYGIGQRVQFAGRFDEMIPAEDAVPV